MRKLDKIWEVKGVVAGLSLVLALSVFGGPNISFGQPVEPLEVCNGKDDQGNGQIDEGVNCDHYLSYLLDKSVQPTSVVLRDQFIEPTDFTFNVIERLFNPARKLHEGLAFNPKRPDLHYLAYRLQSQVDFTPRLVLIDNQFERNIITVTKPRYLLTPTGKRKSGIPIEKILSNVPPAAGDALVNAIVPPIPQNANHYLCYDIEPYDIAKGVSTRDQFQNKQFKVVKARYLCNPAEKRHNGKVSPIVDENNHLMCYEVLPHNKVNRKVVTNNQFGFSSQLAIQTEELCVPTIKTHLPPST